MADEKLHAKHRAADTGARQSDGLDSLAEHEALEYLLFPLQPRGQTQTRWRTDLIHHFGDFAAVLEASEEELMQVGGRRPAKSADDSSAVMACSRYYELKKRKHPPVAELRADGRHLMAKFAWSDYERATWLVWTAVSRVRAAVWLREGTTDRVSLDTSRMWYCVPSRAAPTRWCSATITPTVLALPSMEDRLEATGNIGHRRIGPLNIHLLDHFILTDTAVFLHAGRKPPADPLTLKQAFAVSRRAFICETTNANLFTL